MYNKKISFPPKLKLKPHDNFFATGFICHKEDMSDTYKTFRKLEKNKYIWYINMLSGSDPDLYVNLGDAFLSKGMKEEALSSYKRAKELYEKKGDVSQSQEIQERIFELESLLETLPPESPLIETLPPESPTPEPTSPSSILTPLILIGILLGTAYYIIKKKKGRSWQDIQ